MSADPSSEDLEVGSLQGWNIHGRPGSWIWEAYVGGNREAGETTHRADAEERGRLAHRRLLDNVRRRDR